MSKFMSYFVTEGDDGFALTTSGKIVCGVVTLVLFLLLFLLFNKKKNTSNAEVSDNKPQNKSLFTIKQLAFSSLALAIAYVLSYFKIGIDWLWGGSATLFSMFFVTVIGYWYGPKIGLVSAFAYGILQFLQGGAGAIVSILQLCLDYFVAFGALGLSGFFSNKKHGLVIGYIVAILARGAIHSIGGYLFWMDYMPDNFPKTLAVVYPICYNYAYILLEGILTVALLCLPPVKTCFARLKKMALE